ncbi:MAG: pilus assembly protein [Rhodocyclales bacterium]|nr:pilus assembly protein [Rhodocyclales bacterium]
MPNTAKRNPFKATLLAAALAVLPLATNAAGLGKINVLSALGQPLRAELEVTANRDEALSLVARVASVEAFRQAGIEYSPALINLRFSKEIKERGGRRFIELTTDRPLNEPFIDMLVELNWASGRLVREYTFLLDPPDLLVKAPPVPAPVAPPVADVKPAAKPAAADTLTRAVTESRPPLATERAVVPAPKASVSASRTVVAGDTLGKIAAQTAPAGVSLDQMLVSLFRNNQDAFDGGNMNRLKAGKILSIPDADAASKVSPTEARKEVVAQAVDFNAYRQRLAAAAAASPARDAGAKQEVTGKIAPKVEDKTPAPSGRDKLEVSRTEVTRDAKGKPLQGRIASLEEDLVARDRALKEAGTRIAELEKNLNDLKKLAELKSKGGADLQAAAQAAKPAAAEAKKPEPAPVPAVKPAEAAKPADVPKPAEIAKPADVVKPAETAKPIDGAKPVDPAAPKPAEGDKPPPPKKKAAPPPPPPPEPDFIEENAPLVFGGGAVLALLFGWLGISAYRKKKAASSAANAPLGEADLSAHSVFSSTTVAPPPSEQETSQFSTTGMGMVAAQDTVDPVVEADTFLAFGRDAQAEEILLDALSVDPQPQAIPIRMKLLEIYSGRKDAAKFESVAKEVHGLTGGSGETWEKVSAMGAAVDPANSLYGSASPADANATAVIDLQATTILHGGAAAAAVAAGEAAAASAAEIAAAETSALDFDLDIGAKAAPAAAAVAAETVAESSGLDFDLDLGSDSGPATPAAVADAPRSDDLALDIDFEMPGTAPAAVDMDSGGLDFPLTADAPAAPAAEAAPVAAGPAADGNAIDFSFDLGASEPVAPAPEPMAAALPEMSVDIPELETAPAARPLDLGGLSLELDVPAPTAPAPDVPDNPEVATKLELAAAYEEMGDRDGARELYQEAANEGSPAQKDAARAKLSALG